MGLADCHTLEDVWNDFMQKQADAGMSKHSPQYIENMRRTFYSGMYAIVTMLDRIAFDNRADAAKADEAAKKLLREMLDFFEQILKDDSTGAAK